MTLLLVVVACCADWMSRSSCECALSDEDGTRNMLDSDGLLCLHGDMSRTCAFTTTYADAAQAGDRPTGACAPMKNRQSPLAP